MQGALLSRLARAIATLAVAALMPALPASVSAQNAQVSIDVPKGQVKTVRLMNVPLGTAVAVVLVSSGKLSVAFVSGTQLHEQRPRALFSGAFERKLSFKVVVPESSDYYLMLDNRRGEQDVSATAAIRALRSPTKPPASPKSGKEERA